MTHAYDDPSLDPKQFLLAVMRDKDVAMHDRVRAAEAVAPFVHAQKSLALLISLQHSLPEPPAGKY